MTIRFGRKELGNFNIAEQQEWLITNGIGGYGSGTVGASLSRGYHGYLVAALKPPIDRRLMFVKVDETLIYHQQSYELSSNRWQGDTIAPKGYVNIESFTLEGSIPTWRYRLSDAVIEKRIWMEQGANTVYTAYTVVEAKAPIEFFGRVIVDNRVFHNTGQVASVNVTQPNANSIRVDANNNDTLLLFLSMNSAQSSVVNQRYSNYKLLAEASRGLNDNDSHVHAGTFTTTLQPGETQIIMGCTDLNESLDQQALSRRQAHDKNLLDLWGEHRMSNPTTAPDFMHQFVLAADQFVVKRVINNKDGNSIIAGYHWFGDWGRDTMISLPGLTLTTGRPEIAKNILETYAQFVNEGMLPNRFPDGASQPEYNTIDATFWYFQAIKRYFDATNDEQLVKTIFPKLKEIINAHVAGTRYNIHVDPNDGLLFGGQDGVQLTWMDAKVNNIVITPRIGKPVEVNALWYNALRFMATFAERFGMSNASTYKTMADKVQTSFARFWNADKNYCYDVLDGPSGNDPALRPNQIFAVSLPDSPLTTKQQSAVVDICAQELLTSHGLRSLAPSDPAYIGIYTGDQWHRDSAYHQGTVWGWLIGPFISAHLKVYQNTAQAEQILFSLVDHLQAVGTGNTSEIFDGDAPFSAKGTIAQAWSVAEILRTFEQIEHLKIKN